MSEPIAKEAMEFIQTDRTGWVTKMSVREITQLLPRRNLEQLPLFTETNRPISENHLRGIAKYLEETPNWAMPSIVLATDADGVRKGADRGTIEIQPESLRILDGQHRVQALSNFTAKLAEEAERQASTEQGASEARIRLNEAMNSELPVVIFEVQSIDDQKQMFAWFARNRPIEAAVRSWFDQSDPFNNAAKSAMGNSTVLQGRVNHTRERITAHDDHLLTLTDLKRISFTIAAGLGRHPNKRDVETYLQPEQQNRLQDNLVSFFDDFLPTCGSDYARLGDPDQRNLELSYLRNGTYAFDALTIRLFADAWARWAIEQNQPPEPLAGYVSELNLLKTSPDNDLQRTLGVINSETKRYRGVSDRSWTAASALIREALRE